MFYWDPDRIAFKLPIVGIPIVWYGIFFAFSFFIGLHIVRRIVKRDRPDDYVRFCDRLSLYMVVATVIGARLGHILFYEHIGEYLRAPWRILMTWEGGLASHGGAIAILLALALFSKKEKVSPKRLLDYVVVPTALVGFFIRLGNFVNQEVVGTPTSVPWAVIFGHPADGLAPLPRHPAQLYEGIFYLALFFVLVRLKKMQKGRVGGLFLVCVFGFRFIIEYFKEEQSMLLDGSGLLMGQWLSIPMILLGTYLLMGRARERLARDSL